eukprot:TRINITY_DN22704_c0_g1_i1.p1 TRINITY_DN22704_c0_g1~~TRINITY_DN22704_c0_g1_i1.p1  ORF type:complete len:218 (-),score=25.70 TRINITY_DN22704_c0_g1_i1:720-1373(-)
MLGGGDKASGWHDYLGTYERMLLHLPLSANVLELGVRAGCSLAMWSEYFPFGTIVGVDRGLTKFEGLYPTLKRNGAYSHNNVHTILANATDPALLRELAARGFANHFADVIVDDANHWAHDQLRRFEMLFPEVLRPGGVYIIEDVHIQAEHERDGRSVREYMVALSEKSYLTNSEILVGRHQIEAVRSLRRDWRHQVESVTLLRDVVIITKAPLPAV